MTTPDVPRTMGELVDALITAETRGRDFLLEMVEAFVYMPAIADIWRELMLDEAVHLHRLREFRTGMTADIVRQPISAVSIEQAQSVAEFLNEGRVKAILTLDDAYNLLSEYELCGHHEAVDTLTEICDDVAMLPRTRPKPKHGVAKLQSVLDRLGGRELTQSLRALRPSSLALPRRYRGCHY